MFMKHDNGDDNLPLGAISVQFPSPFFFKCHVEQNRLRSELERHRPSRALLNTQTYIKLPPATQYEHYTVHQVGFLFAQKTKPTLKAMPRYPLPPMRLS